MRKILSTIICLSLLTPFITNAAILNWVGAEGGVTTQEIQSPNGTVSISTATVFDGKYSFRTNPTTTGTGSFAIRSANTDGQTNLRWGINRPRIAFWGRIATCPSAGEEVFADIENSATNRAAFIVLNASCQFGLRDSTGADIATSTQALSLNTWYFFNWDAANGAAGSETVTVYDTSCAQIDTITAVGNFTAATFGVIEIGKRINLMGNSVDFFFDDVVIDSATMPTCQMRIGTLMPNAAGAFSQWTGGTGASDYTQVYERPADTTTYVETSTAGNIFTTLFDPIATSSAAIGTTATIHGVNFFTFLRETTNTAGTKIQNRFTSGATTATTSSRDVSTTLVPNQQTFLTDPNTSAAWTTTALGSLDAGAICVDPLTTTCRNSQQFISILFTPTTATFIPRLILRARMILNARLIIK